MKCLKRDFLPEHLGPILKSNSINGTIAVQARQSIEETLFLLKLAGENTFIKGVVGWINLCSDEIDCQLENLATNRRLVGIRHVLQDEQNDRFMLNDKFIRGISKLNRFNLAYDVLVYPRHLPHVCKLVNRFPEQVFILDHIAKPNIKEQIFEPWASEISKLAQAQNVFCKLSGMVTEADRHKWKVDDFDPYLDIVLNAFGTDRVLFGSDWPVCTVAGTYNQVVNLVEINISRLSPWEQTRIMGETALKVYRLDTFT